MDEKKMTEYFKHFMEEMMSKKPFLWTRIGTVEELTESLWLHKGQIYRTTLKK